MRINKYLAERGVASRRVCDKIIADGKVMLNGRIAKVGDDVREGDEVIYEGAVISKMPTYRYLMMNKPKGYVCTVEDDRDRKTVMQLLPEGQGRLYPVGRLDYDTEGLLLLTNDGDLTFRLTHPKNEIPKTYLVRIDGSISEQTLNRLRTGIELDGKMTAKSKIKVVETNKDFTKLHVTITEGRNRQIRRMFEAVEKEVTFLKRISIGDLSLKSLQRGKTRELTIEEVYYLKNL